MKSQLTFCVSHKAPLVPEHLYDCAVGMGEYWPERGVHISTLDPFWHRMRRVAYGAAGNYAVRHAIRARAAFNTLAGLLSYRKMIVRKDIASADHYLYLREISTGSSTQIRPEDVHPQDGQQYLVASPLECPEGLVHQYAKFHHAIDLFDYIVIAVQVGVIGPPEVDEFARETILIPGGCELGIFPAPWLEETLGKLALVGEEFLHRHGERIITYDKYQVRAVGFLSERLGSYLLRKELRARYPNGIPESVFGVMCAIVPEGEHYAPGVTDN